MDMDELSEFSERVFNALSENPDGIVIIVRDGEHRQILAEFLKARWMSGKTESFVVWLAHDFKEDSTHWWWDGLGLFEHGVAENNIGTYGRALMATQIEIEDLMLGCEEYHPIEGFDDLLSF